MRFFVEDEGKLYELVRSTEGCKWDPSKNQTYCQKRLECRAAADLLFGSYLYRHWEEVRMG